MISSISLGNFKAFADKQTLPIKPITLIFGANSSGKSSIIHNILFEHEAITSDSKNLDIYYTNLGGESVDLGGFKQFVNRRDAEKNVLFGLELNVKELSKRLNEIFYKVEKLTFYIEIGLENIIENVNPVVTSIELLTDNAKLFKMSRKKSGELEMDIINNENDLVNYAVEFIIMVFTSSIKNTDSDKKIFLEALNKLVPEIKIEIENFLPTGVKGLERFSDPRTRAYNPEIKAINKENRAKVVGDISYNILPFFIDEIFYELNKCITEEFRSMEYLGPLRSYPERHFSLSKSKGNNWKPGGGYAWEVVANNKDVRNKVNEWLGSDKLKQKYELRIADLIPEYLINNELPLHLNKSAYDMLIKFFLNFKLDSDSFDRFFDNVEMELINSQINGENVNDILDADWSELSISESLVTEIEKCLRSNSSTQNFIELLKESTKENLTDLILFDKNSNTQVSHRDVGIGITQVLPVLVSAFANKEKIIAIEQPEIHLHPALQAELGDLFINSALGENNNTFIIETHSEHLILRILRRIRETTNGELKEGMIPIKPEDVQVVYVRPSDKGAEIVNLEIDEEGDFKTKWPDGFFADRAEELF